MDTLAQLLEGCQMVLPITWDIQEVFEDYVTETHKTFLKLILKIEESLPPIDEAQPLTGRRRYLLKTCIRAFIGKSFFNITTNKDLILRLKTDAIFRRICGFSRVPSEATCSRRFSDLAESNILETIHHTMITESFKEVLVGHISRDSTAIAARERAVRGNKLQQPKPRKRGRPKKGARREPTELSQLQFQRRVSAEESLSRLNTACSWSGKKNSKGKTSFWCGYKLHLDVTDMGVPVTAVVTGANVHDSQVAIPMEQLTEQRVIHLYSVMDRAYDAEEIRSFIEERGRVALIDRKKRRGQECIPLAPHEQERYKIRSTVERSYAHLKDWFIPDKLYVKGYKNIRCTLQLGVLCLTAVKLMQYFS